MTRFILVNQVDELRPRMTTSMLIEAAAREGLDPLVIEVGELWLAEDGRCMARARRPEGSPAAREDDRARARWLSALAGAEPETYGLRPDDRLWIRTNPARDPGRRAEHGLALELARLASDRGIQVVNHPRGLALAASKLYLSRLPSGTTPRSLVATRPERLRHFVETALSEVVLKPLSGSRGAGVFRVTAGDPNLASMIELLLSSGPVIAQDWVADDQPGDLRVLLLDGRPLGTDDARAAIRRLPAAGDFRSNLHAGGRAVPGDPTPAQVATLDAIGPGLAADGLRLVGVDLIGDQVIELNVFSTGGLRDAERFTGVDFSQRIVRSLSADDRPRTASSGLEHPSPASQRPLEGPRS